MRKAFQRAGFSGRHLHDKSKTEMGLPSPFFMFPAGIEPASKAPEAYVLSIILQEPLVGYSIRGFGFC